MKQIAGALLVLTLGVATACSRHVVIERWLFEAPLEYSHATSTLVSSS